MLVVPTEEIAFEEHSFWPVYRDEFITQHVQFPTLHLMSRYQVHIPKLDDAVAIRNPYKRLVPEKLGPFEEGPSSCG